jgi:hypothetical protein
MCTTTELACRTYPRHYKSFGEFLTGATALAQNVVDMYGEGAVDEILKQFPCGDFYKIEVELARQHVELSAIAIKKVEGDLPNMFREELLKVARM